MFRSSTHSKHRGKVFVGMSGGVDSSVAASLLVEQGYDVTGVFIKVWQPDWIECTWKEDRLDAMRVAAHLDIPFITLDLEKEYKEEVVDYMIAEYRAGRTPNPDVMCNKYVKFGGFYDYARAQGADFVATGHYAQVKRVVDKNENQTSVENKGNSTERAELHMSKDDNKDQTYFLWTLNQEQLQHTLFPVGHMTKPEVRAYAEKHNLITAGKKDSQGLCFIGKVDIKDFLSRFIPQKEGAVLNEAGEVIGTHPGSMFFTIGERHGFTVTKKGPNDGALYVIRKNVEANAVTVGEKREGELEGSKRTSVWISRTNWTLGKALEIGEVIMARSRYRERLTQCKIVEIDSATNRACIEFSEAQSTLTAGQSLVMYSEGKCLGGGILT